MNNSLANIYDVNFYNTQRSDSLKSATLMMTYFANFYEPQSVVDFGCGVGGWLHAIGQLSAEKLTGIDGSWVNKNELFSEKINFIETNLSVIDEYAKYRKNRKT